MPNPPTAPDTVPELDDPPVSGEHAEPDVEVEFDEEIYKHLHALAGRIHKERGG